MPFSHIFVFVSRRYREDRSRGRTPLCSKRIESLVVICDSYELLAARLDSFLCASGAAFPCGGGGRRGRWSTEGRGATEGRGGQERAHLSLGGCHGARHGQGSAHVAPEQQLFTSPDIRT
jgi:hypothetical protein